MKKYFQGSKVNLTPCSYCGETGEVFLSFSERPLCPLCLESRGLISKYMQTSGVSVRSLESLHYYGKR